MQAPSTDSGLELSLVIGLGPRVDADVVLLPRLLGQSAHGCGDAIVIAFVREVRPVRAASGVGGARVDARTSGSEDARPPGRQPGQVAPEDLGLVVRIREAHPRAGESEIDFGHSPSVKGSVRGWPHAHGRPRHRVEHRPSAGGRRLSRRPASACTLLQGDAAAVRAPGRIGSGLERRSGAAGQVRPGGAGAGRGPRMLNGAGLRHLRRPRRRQLRRRARNRAPGRPAWRSTCCPARTRRG